MEGWPSTFAIHSIQLCSRVARFGCVSSHQEEEKERHFESGGPWYGSQSANETGVAWSQSYTPRRYARLFGHYLY